MLRGNIFIPRSLKSPDKARKALGETNGSIIMKHITRVYQTSQFAGGRTPVLSVGAAEESETATDPQKAGDSWQAVCHRGDFKCQRIRRGRSRYRNHSSSKTFSALPVGHFVSLANIAFKIITNSGDRGAGEQPLYFS